MVIKASGKELDIDILKDGLGVEYSGDNSLLTQEIGPIEFSEIGGAIKTLYEWYEANKQIIGKGELL
jgi:GDP-L-fucose synthase